MARVSPRSGRVKPAPPARRLRATRQSGSPPPTLCGAPDRPGPSSDTRPPRRPPPPPPPGGPPVVGGPRGGGGGPKKTGKGPPRHPWAAPPPGRPHPPPPGRRPPPAPPRAGAAPLCSGALAGEGRRQNSGNRALDANSGGFAPGCRPSAGQPALGSFSDLGLCRAGSSRASVFSLRGVQNRPNLHGGAAFSRASSPRRPGAHPLVIGCPTFLLDIPPLRMTDYDKKNPADSGK